MFCASQTMVLCLQKEQHNFSEKASLEFVGFRFQEILFYFGFVSSHGLALTLHFFFIFLMFRILSCLIMLMLVKIFSYSPQKNVYFKKKSKKNGRPRTLFILKNVIIKFEMCKHDNLEIKGPIKKLNVDMFDLSLASKKVIMKHDF